MDKSEIAIVRIVVDHNGHMAQLFRVLAAAIEHQVATAQLVGIVDFLPPVVQLTLNGTFQRVTKMPKHIIGESRTVELLGAVASMLVWHAHEGTGVIDDAVGQEFNKQLFRNHGLHLGPPLRLKS